MSLYFLGRWNIGEFGEGGVDIDEFNDPSTWLTISIDIGCPNNQRGFSSLFKKSSLLPDTIVFAQVVAMVTPENDNGIVRQVELIEGVKYSANLGVDKGNACIIRLHCLEAVNSSNP